MNLKYMNWQGNCNGFIQMHSFVATKLPYKPEIKSHVKQKKTMVKDLI